MTDENDDDKKDDKDTEEENEEEEELAEGMGESGLRRTDGKTISVLSSSNRSR